MAPGPPAGGGSNESNKSKYRSNSMQVDFNLGITDTQGEPIGAAASMEAQNAADISSEETKKLSSSSQ